MKTNGETLGKRCRYPVDDANYPLTAERPVKVFSDGVVTPLEIEFLHRHNCFEIGWCTGGGSTISVTAAGMEYVRPGELLLFAEGVPHYSCAAAGGRAHWNWYYLNFPLLLSRTAPDFDGGFLTAWSDGGFHARLRARTPEATTLIRLLEGLGATPESAVFARRAWGVLIADFLRQLHAAEAGTEGATRHDATRSEPRIAPALVNLAANYRKQLSVGALARSCHMSVSNFRRVFLAATGTAPLEYIERFRIAVARGLLETGRLPIGEVASACGFRSLSSFNRQFRRQSGQTPRDCRARKPRKNTDKSTFQA